MGGNIADGYKNNTNIIVTRAGNKNHVYTDRPIDIDGDGIDEEVTVVTTQKGGNKVKNVATKNAGSARTVVDETFEPDGGINLTGDNNTEGVG